MLVLRRTFGLALKRALGELHAQGSRAEPKNTAAITVLPPLLPLPSSLPLLYHCYRHCNTLEHLCHLLYRHRQDASHRCCPQPKGWAHCIELALLPPTEELIILFCQCLPRSTDLHQIFLHSTCTTGILLHQVYHHFLHLLCISCTAAISPCISCTAAISSLQLYCRHLFASAVLPPSLRFSCTAAFSSLQLYCRLLFASAVLPPSLRFSCTAAFSIIVPLLHPMQFLELPPEECPNFSAFTAS